MVLYTGPGPSIAARTSPAIGGPPSGQSEQTSSLPSDNSLDAPVRHEPDDGNQHVKRDRDPRIDEREDDSGTIEDLQYLAFEVAAERFGQY